MRPFVWLVPAFLTLGACQVDSRQQVLATGNTQVAQRAISSRAFDTRDRNIVFRATLATLQDLGFVIDRADDVLGTVTATRAAGAVVRLTVIVRPISGERTLVRASGQHNLEALTDPLPFQRFFTALSQSLFLTANEVD
jgi:hypothetical protein